MNSVNIVSKTSTVRRAVNKLRGQLEVGDLYRNSDTGRVYMHTGYRTAPPSGSDDVTVQVNGETVYKNDASSRTTGSFYRGGRKVLAAQSIIVQGKIKGGEDGSAVTFDLEKHVQVVGKASIDLELWA